MDLKHFRWRRTCEACPEQYEVFDGEEQVGYIRLRWGRMTVSCPNVGGETVLALDVGDGFQGSFDSEKQRSHYLGLSEAAIKEWMATNESSPVGT